jgi:predicted AAA+ superfamily ATPase
MYKRAEYQTIKKRIESESRKLIQVIIGPRQVGKTTLIKQYLKNSLLPWHYTSADSITGQNSAWLQQQWETARIMKNQLKATEYLLVIDEIQKVNNWSEFVKTEWDLDTFNGTSIRLILLGSSSLMIQKGLSESLTGRFEIIHLNHWSLSEMHEAFGYSAEQFAWFGGYPGAAEFTKDENRWRQYIIDSLVDPSIMKDILMISRVDKPALLRKVFELACIYSGQILSFNKMLGQLQDAGNTTTLSHYLKLLDYAGLVTGLEKFYREKLNQRGSSPKFQVYNTALHSAQIGFSFAEIRQRPEMWGRIVESAIGAHLINHAKTSRLNIYYWRHKNDEMDFIIEKGDKIIGIEVKSGSSHKISRMTPFHKQFKPLKIIMVGKSGIPWEEFLSINPEELF